MMSRRVYLLWCTILSAVVLLYYRPAGLQADTDAVRPCQQTERRSTLQQYCQRRRSADGTQPQTVMYVDHKHKAVYCPVPKASSSSWRALLVREKAADYNHSAGWSDYQIDHPVKLQRLGIQLYSSLPEDEQRDIMHRYFKFTMVRHPLARLASAYRDKFVEMDDYEPYFRPYIINHFRHNTSYKSLFYYRQQYLSVRGYLEGHQNLSKSDEDSELGRTYRLYQKYKDAVRNNDSQYLVTFTEFLRFVISLPATKHDQHWLPMVHRCDFCNIHFDFIGKVDTIEQDAHTILQQMSAKAVIRSSTIGRVRSYDPSSIKILTHKRLEAYRGIDPDLVDKVLDYYKDDMLAFGYSWDRHDLLAQCLAAGCC